MQISNSVLASMCWNDEKDTMGSEPVSASTAARLGACCGLKTFPIVAARVISLLDEPYFTIDQITDCIREDPALAAGVLKLANSAFFSPLKPVGTIDNAIIRLGRNTISEVVFAVATMELFPDLNGLGKAIRDHCAATAAICHSLAMRVPGVNVEELFLAGLMHDIGKMLLIDSGEMTYKGLDPIDVIAPDNIHQFEREALGFDHSAVGGEVLVRWKVAEPVPKIVAWHHSLGLAYRDASLSSSIAVLRVANAVENQLAFKNSNIDEAWNRIGLSNDAKMIHLGVEGLIDVWPELEAARDVALKIFG